MTKTVQLELALTASIALVLRKRGGDKVQYEIGKEMVDHLHYTVFANDAFYRDRARRRGAYHDHTRTTDTRLFIVGDAFAVLQREARSAGFHDPLDSQQRLAEFGITYRVEGYTSPQGGNRHIITITDEALDALALDERIGPDAARYAAILLEQRVRFPSNVPCAPRTPQSRSISLRSRNEIRARQLLLLEKDRPAFFDAWLRVLQRVMTVTTEKRRLLRDADVVSIPSDSIDPDEEPAFRALKRRGMIHYITDGARTAIVANLRFFRCYTLPEADPVRRALRLDAFKPPC